jgi:hypothetical protein
VQVAGSEVGTAATGDGARAGGLVGAPALPAPLARQAAQARSASPASAPIKSHNFRNLETLPFTVTTQPWGEKGVNLILPNIAKK